MLLNPFDHIQIVGRILQFARILALDIIIIFQRIGAAMASGEAASA